MHEQAGLFCFYSPSVIVFADSSLHNGCQQSFFSTQPGATKRAIFYPPEIQIEKFWRKGDESLREGLYEKFLIGNLFSKRLFPFFMLCNSHTASFSTRASVFKIFAL